MMNSNTGHVRLPHMAMAGGCALIACAAFSAGLAPQNAFAAFDASALSETSYVRAAEDDGSGKISLQASNANWYKLKNWVWYSPVLSNPSAHVPNWKQYYPLGDYIWRSKMLLTDGVTPVTLSSLGTGLVPSPYSDIYEFSTDYDMSNVPMLSADDYEFAGWYEDDTNTLISTDANSGPSAPGDYYMKFKGKGEYTGTLRIDFYLIDATDIANWGVSHGLERGYYADAASTITDGKTPLVFSPEAIQIYCPMVVDGEAKYVKLDSDHFEFDGWYQSRNESSKISDDPKAGPSEYGYYYVKIKGTNGYTGSQYCPFSIDDGLRLYDWNSSVTNPVDYTGKNVTLSDMNLQLYYDDCYSGGEVERKYLDSSAYRFAGWQDSNFDILGTDENAGPSEPGTYRLVLENTKDADDSLEIRFSIVDKNAKPPAEPEKPVQPGSQAKPVGTYLNSGKASYLVTKAGGSPQVAFLFTTDESSVKVPKSVKVDGVSYSVTSVAANAFKDNASVTSVSVGSNVKSIGKQAFAGTIRLKSVTLGKSVKTVAKGAFKGAKKLKTVTVKSGKLGAKGIKNMLSGSSIKTIKLSGTAVKKAKKTYVKAAGKKAAVK